MGVIEQVSRFDEDLRALRNERHHVSSAQIADSIRRLQQHGLADPDLDPAIAAAGLGAMTYRFPEMWFVQGLVDCDFDLGVEQLTRLFVNALGLQAPAADGMTAPAAVRRPRRRLIVVTEPPGGRTRTVTTMAKRTGRPQHPRLPGDLAPAGDIDGVDDVELIGLTVQGDCSDRRFAGLHVEESHICRPRSSGRICGEPGSWTSWSRGRTSPEPTWRRRRCRRVEFVDCRLSAAQVARTTMEDVTFTECKLDDANFRMSQVDRILFDHVNLRGAEFSAARLSSAFFFDCDATGAEFSQVVMPGARFHGSSLADIEGGQSMRDIVIDSAQVLPLALRVFTDLGIRHRGRSRYGRGLGRRACRRRSVPRSRRCGETTVRIMACTSSSAGVIASSSGARVDPV